MFCWVFKAKVDTTVLEFEPFVANHCEAITGVVDEFLEETVDEFSKLRKWKTSELDPLPSSYFAYPVCIAWLTHHSL